MLSIVKLGSNPGTRSPWRERWAVARDLLGGGLVLVAWAALWTGVWAAVAGPLAPIP